MTKRTWLGGISVGDGQDVAVAGALNVSPESFYDGSVVIQADHLLRAAEAMTRAGAAFVDVGAMSTAPYLAARIPESQEADRLAWAIDLLVKKLDLPISADTSRSLPARAALAAGARIINDVTGLTGDRSEEHTSELQSRENLVCRLLLEKKKKKIKNLVFVYEKIIKL